MSLPTALGKNRFLTSRCLPTIVIIMVSLIQYYFLEMIPTVVVNFQRFPTLDAKKLVNAPKMSAHHRGICHF